jgi:cytoskeletal protein RodZ
MQSVGQRLREARLQLGRSLEDVSASTRIAIKTLLAIEADELEKLGAPFLYRSFVRQFAKELKVNDEQFDSDVQAAARTMPEPLMPGQGSNGPFPGVNALPVRRQRGFKWLHSVASLIAMLIACSAIYSVWQNSRSNLQTSFKNIFSAATESKRATSLRTVNKSAHSSNAPVTQISEATSQVASKMDNGAGDGVFESSSEEEGAYRIELSAIEPTWLSIIADGRRAFSGILEATDTKVLEAHENVRIRTGNAGGVNVTLNGKALGAIGPRGQVRTMILTKDAYEILPPEPHMSLTEFTPSGE